MEAGPAGPGERVEMIQKFGDYYFDPRYIALMQHIIPKQAENHEERLAIDWVSAETRIRFTISDKESIDKLLGPYQPKGE